MDEVEWHAAAGTLLHRWDYSWYDDDGAMVAGMLSGHSYIADSALDQVFDCVQPLPLRRLLHLTLSGWRDGRAELQYHAQTMGTVAL